MEPIYTGLGAVEYVDVPAPAVTDAEYMIALGSWELPGEWHEPDDVVENDDDTVTLRLLIGQDHVDPVAGTYWLWRRTSADPETFVRESSLSVRVVTDTGTPIDPAVHYATADDVTEGDAETLTSAKGYADELAAGKIDSDLTVATDEHGILWRVRLTGDAASSDQNIMQVDLDGTSTSWDNERGFRRGKGQDNFDAILRMFQNADWGDRTHQGVGICAVEILSADRHTQAWGIRFVDGAPMHDGIATQPVLKWTSGDPDPTEDTTGKFGHGAFPQTIGPNTWVDLYLEAEDTVPDWAPAGRTTVYTLDAAES